jgi:hypothetical protein
VRDFPDSHLLKNIQAEQVSKDMKTSIDIMHAVMDCDIEHLENEASDYETLSKTDKSNYKEWNEKRAALIRASVEYYKAIRKIQ